MHFCWTKKAWAAIFCCLLCGLVTMARAQSGEPAPAIHPGDTWTFDKLVFPDRREPWTETVLAMGPQGGYLVQRGERRRILTPAANFLDQSKHEIPQLRFPLKVGDTWEYSWDWRNATGTFLETLSLKYKVVGVEDVVVPAGKFRAYKLTGNGFVKDKSTITPLGGDTRHEETYWYAPEVKRIIKYTGKQLKWAPPNYLEVWSSAYELASYSLAPPSAAPADSSRPTADSKN